jgi:hypothetical protein
MSQEPRLETGAGTRSKLICLAPKLLWMSWKGRGKPERGDTLARVEKDDVGREQRENYQVSVAALEAVLNKRMRQCITDAQQVGESSETTNNSDQCTPSGPNPRWLTLSTGKTDKARLLGAHYLCFSAT